MTNKTEARRGSFASHADEFELSPRERELAAQLKQHQEEIAETGAALVEGLKLQPHEAADKAARYHELKKRAGVLIADTGEVLTFDKYDRELADLNKLLKPWIEENGAIDIEGMPSLELQPRSTEEADASALLEHEPEIFFALVAARAVKVDCKLARKVLNPDQVTRLNGYAHKLGQGAALVFKERER